MLRTRQWIAYCAAFAAATLAYETENAEARPKYLKVFGEVYPDRAPTASCALCHIGNDKTNRTEYGIAVEEALGSKNVSDHDTIKAALMNAESSLPAENADGAIEPENRVPRRNRKLDTWRNWASTMKSIQN